MDAVLLATLVSVFSLYAIESSMWSTAFKGIHQHQSTAELDLAIAGPGTQLAFHVGMALGLQAVLQGKVMVIWGFCGDYFNKVILLGLSMLLLGVTNLGVGSGLSLPASNSFLYVSSVASSAIPPLLQAMVVGVARPSEYGRYLGYQCAAICLSSLTGTIFASFSGDPLAHPHSHAAPVWRQVFVALSWFATMFGTLFLAAREKLPWLAHPPPSAADNGCFGLRKLSACILPLVLGFFLALAWSALGFQVMLLRNVGHTSFEISSLLWCFFIASAGGAVFGGNLSDHLINQTHIRYGRLFPGILALFLCLASLGFLASHHEDMWRADRLYVTKVLVSACLGCGIMTTYVGSVKPSLLEVVPIRCASAVTGVAAALELQAATILGPVLIGVLAEGLFDYKVLGDQQLPSAQLANVQALGKAVCCLMVGCLVGALSLLAGIGVLMTKEKGTPVVLEKVLASSKPH